MAIRTQRDRQSGHSDTVTEGVRVQVASKYLEDQSLPEQGHYLFAYRVRITNEGDAPVQLLARHWVIRDADGESEEVRGPGVIGEQPVIAPGATHEYTSGCPLPTEWGTMEGRYRMQGEDGNEFDALVGRFFLARNVAPISH